MVHHGAYHLSSHEGLAIKKSRQEIGRRRVEKTMLNGGEKRGDGNLGSEDGGASVSIFWIEQGVLWGGRTFDS